MPTAIVVLLTCVSITVHHHVTLALLVKPLIPTILARFDYGFNTLFLHLVYMRSIHGLQVANIHAALDIHTQHDRHAYAYASSLAPDRQSPFARP